MDLYAQQALEEYNSEATAAHPGGVDGRPFWNVHSTQFIFNPSFSFSQNLGAEKFLFTATDCNGKEHSFKTDNSSAFLTPIWGELPTGYVTLKVEVLDQNDNPEYLLGARTFFKASPFPGRENLPPRACSYKECAFKALRYVYNDPTVQHWLTYGKPEPDYYHNVYPSKTISSIVDAMISYAKLDSENADNAIRLAVRATDYLISLTYGEDSPLAGLPPTYSFKDLNEELVLKTAPAAGKRKDLQMMIYPASAGNAYLKLEKATGDIKYFEAAKRIAEYYKENVLPNGSWYLLVSAETGKPVADNFCLAFSILDFIHNMYERTGEEVWQELEKNYYKHFTSECLDKYNWEGQFEDSTLSGNYSNLTHLEADKLIKYIAQNMADDPKMIAEAEDLMRFVEDQFVVWGEFATWNPHYKEGESYWYSPAGLEQYHWYVPIDASTSRIMDAFLDVYTINKNPLLLEKACALGDSITRMQNSESGIIPTHWMKKDCMTNIENFWFNCQIATGFYMMRLAEIMGEI